MVTLIIINNIIFHDIYDSHLKYLFLIIEFDACRAISDSLTL